MKARAPTRLVLITAVQDAVDRRPDLAFLRSRMERSARRTEDPWLRVVTGLTLRAFDRHPAVGERVVRLWLRRAAEREKQALDFARSGHREEDQRRKLPGLGLGPDSRGIEPSGSPFSGPGVWER